MSIKSDHIPKVRRHAETIAALAATEYQFILAKQSVIAAAALAAAVKGLLKEQTEAEEVVKSLAARIKCSTSEVEYAMSHIEYVLFTPSSIPHQTPVHSTPFQNSDQKHSRSGSQTPTNCTEISNIAFV